MIYPDPKTDCILFNRNNINARHGLTEMQCRLKQNCRFYKSNKCYNRDGSRKEINDGQADD